MFKFLKSKKGFTLVELMIVVVIMAILVAVAVPIYSAVTKNARKKTCLANQREIQSQINNASMTNILPFKADDEYKLTTNDTADNGTWSVTTGTVTTEQLGSLFQKVPYCPEKGSVITVTITNGTVGTSEEAALRVATACSSTNGHS